MLYVGRGKLAPEADTMFTFDSYTQDRLHDFMIQTYLGKPYATGSNRIHIRKQDKFDRVRPGSVTES